VWAHVSPSCLPVVPDRALARRSDACVFLRLDAETHLHCATGCGKPTLASDMHQNGPLMSANLPGQVESTAAHIHWGGLPIPWKQVISGGRSPGGDHTSGVGSSRTAAGHAAAPEHFLRRELSHLLRFPLRSSWFDPWNEKWFAGSRRPPYPPLGHQWIALFSYVIGLKMAYMLVQLIAVLLLPVGVLPFCAPMGG